MIDECCSRTKEDRRAERLADDTTEIEAILHAHTHCKWGHEFTPDNTRLVAKGRRCIACARRRARESAQRKKANA